MPKYILVAVDGTGSHEWFNGGNSHTRKFFEQFNTQGGSKIYMHGPDDTVTGRDAQQRINDAKIFIEDSIRTINFERGNLEYIPAQSHFKNLAGLVPQGIGRLDVTDIEFVFIGHSRGGAVVMELSKNLPKNAVFMGLFDAVDRSNVMDVTDFISNHNHPKSVYHALRKGSSRISFGHAVIMDDKDAAKYPWYHQRSFDTSHGGTNGSYDLNPKEFSQDYSCSTDTLLDPKYTLALNRASVWLMNSVSKDYRNKRAENCIQEAIAADSWIREGAAWAELTFDGTELQSIVYDKNDGHVKKR